MIEKKEKTEVVSVTKDEGLTVSALKKMLPKWMGVPNEELLGRLNTLFSDREEMEAFKENMLHFGGVLKEGKFTIDRYLNAVLYMSFKLQGDTNREAYRKTFPDRYERMQREGISTNQQASIISSYNKSRMVTRLYEMSMIPTHILNQPIYQQAINVQAHLMQNATSEKVRSDAAACLIVQLRPPEVKKMELDISYQEDESLQALRESTMALAAQARDLISSGRMTPKSIAESPILVEALNEK